MRLYYIPCAGIFQPLFENIFSEIFLMHIYNIFMQCRHNLTFQLSILLFFVQGLLLSQEVNFRYRNGAIIHRYSEGNRILAAKPQYENGGYKVMKINSREEFEKQNMFGTGLENTVYAKFFVGQSFLNPLTKPEDGLFLANVTFEPGCRNNWHIHHAKKGGGQILVCTAGEGWYQEEGKEAVSLFPGTVIVIPANVKHWHGAKKDSWFSHIAVEVNGEGCETEWCGPVSDETYDGM